MEHKGSLYFTIGLARGGKSTVCKRWVDGQIGICDGKVIERGINQYYIGDCLPEKPLPRVLVCDDHIRLALTGCRYNYLAESQVLACKYTMIRALLFRHDVICDDTHTTIHSLKKILEIDPAAKFVFVPTSPKVCKERAIKSNQPDLVKPIERMYNNLVLLTGETDMYDIGHKLKSAIDALRVEVSECKEYSDRIV